MEQYEVIASRDGKWWNFEIPALTSPSPRGGDHRIVAMGQAQHVSEIADAARAVISMWHDVSESSVDVNITFQLPSQVRADLDDAKDLEEAGRLAIEKASMLRRRAIRVLRTEVGYSQVETAAILEVSRQRVQQLENT